MLNSLISEVRLLRSGIRTMYGDPGAAAGRIRHEHLSAVLRLTPMAMVANMGNASLILWSFKDSLTPGLFSWWAVMMTLASLSLLSWFRFRNRCSTQVSCRAIRRSTLHAGVLACWRWPGVVFPWCGSPMPGTASSWRLPPCSPG